MLQNAMRSSPADKRTRDLESRQGIAKLQIHCKGPSTSSNIPGAIYRMCGNTPSECPRLISDVRLCFPVMRCLSVELWQRLKWSGDEFSAELPAVPDALPELLDASHTVTTD